MSLWHNILEKIRMRRREHVFPEKPDGWIGPIAVKKHQTWSADKQHIIGYDPGHLFNYGFLYVLKGTVFTKRVFIAICVNLIITTIYGAAICPNPKCSDNNKFTEEVCVSLYGRGMCTMQYDSTGGLLLMSIGAFLVSIFINLTLSRWWEIRNSVSNLIGATNNLFLNVSVYQDDVVINENIVRLAIAAQYLVYNQAAGMTDVLSIVYEHGILTKEEKNLLQKIEFSGKYLLVLQWCSSLILKAYKIPSIQSGEFGLTTMQNSINEMRISSARIFTLINTQLPYTYVHIVTVVCKLHTLLVSLWAATILGYAVASSSVGESLQAYILSIINTVIFEGLLEIHAQLYQPFGTNPWQFPVNDYIKLCHSSGKSLVRQSKKPQCLLTIETRETHETRTPIPISIPVVPILSSPKISPLSRNLQKTPATISEDKSFKVSL
jgi:hypothetical protein